MNLNILEMHYSRQRSGWFRPRLVAVCVPWLITDRAQEWTVFPARLGLSCYPCLPEGTNLQGEAHRGLQDLFRFQRWSSRSPKRDQQTFTLGLFVRSLTWIPTQTQLYLPSKTLSHYESPLQNQYLILILCVQALVKQISLFALISVLLETVNQLHGFAYISFSRAGSYKTFEKRMRIEATSTNLSFEAEKDVKFGI